MPLRKAWNQLRYALEKFAVFGGIPYSIGKGTQWFGYEPLSSYIVAGLTLLALYVAWIEFRFIELNDEIKGKRFIHKRQSA